MTRCIAYVRQSKGKDGESAADALSLDAQEAAIRRYCAERGWEVVRTIRDHDLSGEDWDRPGMRELLAAAAAGDADAVVVYKVSRFARDALFQELTHRELKRRGVALHSVTEPGVERTLIRLILGAVNQHHNEDLSEWLKTAIAARAHRGLHHGRDPYGYRVATGGGLEIDPEQAAVVQRIFAMRADGMGMIAIANRLNAEGIRSKTGTSWGAPSVRSLLRNPTYAGYAVLRGEIVGDLDPANTPRIIDRPLWHQVQRMWQSGRAVATSADLMSWVQGLVDHACGAKMWIVSGRMGAHGERLRYLDCGNHGRPTLKRCQHPRQLVSLEPIERAAAACLAADLANLPPSLDAALAAHAAALGKPDALTRRADLERQRDHLRASITRAEDLVIGGLRDAAWFREQDARLQADLTAVDAALAALTDVPAAADIAPAFQQVRDLAAAVPLMRDETRRRVMLALGRIRWDGSVRIVYAPEYRPLFPNPVAITPRWQPSRNEWEIESPA